MVDGPWLLLFAWILHLRPYFSGMLTRICVAGLVLMLQSCSLFLKPNWEYQQEEVLPLSQAPLPVGSVPGAFYRNVAYGLHPRQVFDILVPQSDGPVPLVIYIHGGGFIRGGKEGAYNDDNGEKTPYDTYFTALLNAHIAVATINYRLLEKHDSVGVMKALMDGKLCLQYIRYHCERFNIDPDNIQLCGNSAGAGMAFWIGLQDDMADPDSNDPVLQQSTRVKSIAVIATQSTYDLERWTAEVFAQYNPKSPSVNRAFIRNPIVRMYMKRMLFSFYGISSKKELYTDAGIAYRKKVDFLQFLSADDPELYIENLSVPYERPHSFNVVFHHANHAKLLQRKAYEAGMKTVCHYHHCETESDEDFVSFLIRKAAEG